MSSQALSVDDEPGGEVKGGEEVTERRESEVAVECPYNGLTAAEEEGNGGSESEFGGGEDVLYDTSSHEQLESSSGSAGSERTWEERCAGVTDYYKTTHCATDYHYVHVS